MVEFLSSSYEKEIHKVGSPFSEDSKNVIFSREALISREGRPENLGKMGNNNRDIYCYANLGLVNFEREYWPLPPGINILVVPQFFYMPDQILEKKKGKNSISKPKFDLFYGLPLPKYKDIFKNFTYDQTSFVMDLE